MKKLTKILEVLFYYLLPIFLFALFLFKPERDLMILSAKAAQILLIYLLFLKPIARIIPHKIFTYLLGVRRQFGVAAFWFFLFHGGGIIYQQKIFFNLEYYLNPQSFIFWGLIAGIGMTILGLSSNIIANKILKRHWKKVQLIAYPTLFFSLLHSSMAEGELEKFYVLSFIFVALKVTQYIRKGFEL